MKIDKSFVQRQQSDPAARVIVEAIIELAMHLGLGLTAEGVETEQQLAILRQQGCATVQGWLFARPMSGDTIVARFWPHVARRSAPEAGPRADGGGGPAAAKTTACDAAAGGEVPPRQRAAVLDLSRPSL